MPLPFSRINLLSNPPSQPTVQKLPMRTAANTEPRDAQAFLAGVDVSESTWGEWDQLVTTQGALHA